MHLNFVHISHLLYIAGPRVDGARHRAEEKVVHTRFTSCVVYPTLILALRFGGLSIPMSVSRVAPLHNVC